MAHQDSRGASALSNAKNYRAACVSARMHCLKTKTSRFGEAPIATISRQRDDSELQRLRDQSSPVRNCARPLPKDQSSSVFVTSEIITSDVAMAQCSHSSWHSNL